MSDVHDGACAAGEILRRYADLARTTASSTDSRWKESSARRPGMRLRAVRRMAHTAAASHIRPWAGDTDDHREERSCRSVRT